jgi:hypothetical protein
MKMQIVPSKADFMHDYNQYVDKATILIHAPETRDSVIAMLDGPDPVQQVANATLLVTQRLDMAARQSGIEVEDGVKMYGANQIVRLICEVAAAAGKFNLPEPLIKLAFTVACQDYINGEIAAGRINRQQLRVQVLADIRQMPPKLRKQVQQAPAEIQQTARLYNHGKGIAKFMNQPSQATTKPGLIGTAPTPEV